MSNIKKSDIVEVLTRVMIDYFRLMTQSEIISKMKNSDHVFFVGANSLLHVFVSVYARTNDARAVYTNCQTAYYCYLEYIEQISKTNSVHNLNNRDAVMFIYNKTLSNVSTSNANLSIELSDFLKTLDFTIHTLMNWNNPNITQTNRLEICSVYVIDYLNLFCVHSEIYQPASLFQIIELIQVNTSMSYDTYSLFLRDVYKYNKKRKTIPYTIVELETKFIKLSSSACKAEMALLYNTPNTDDKELRKFIKNVFAAH